tara:strand:+ start:395 stop:505 length:111 start_codon:yes stop_codon:yes gene_type:complete
MFPDKTSSENNSGADFAGLIFPNDDGKTSIGIRFED